MKTDLIASSRKPDCAQAARTRGARNLILTLRTRTLHRLKFCLITVAAACILAACDGMKYREAQRLNNFSVTADDFNEIAKASLALIDPNKNISVIMVPATLDPRALAALKRERRVDSAMQASPTATEVLPAGTFLIRDFSIDMVDAQPLITFAGQLGPVTREITAANMPDCGLIYSVIYVLRGDGWFSPSYKVETCAESRHWTPVDK